MRLKFAAVFGAGVCAGWAAWSALDGRISVATMFVGLAVAYIVLGYYRWVGR